MDLMRDFRSVSPAEAMGIQPLLVMQRYATAELEDDIRIEMPGGLYTTLVVGFVDRKGMLEIYTSCVAPHVLG